MTHTTPRDPAAVRAAEDLLARWIGLDPDTVGSASIARAVRTRMEALGVDDPAAVVERAVSDEAERDRLVEEVVVGESWFFRDPQVFAFVCRFATTVAALPGRAPIRVLCAPCAGGEEPYSIAIGFLESGLTPDQFTIDAIDISRVAIERARQGRYSANAFRNADCSFRDRWFHREGQGSVLDEAIRRQVRFTWGNLLDGSFVTEQLGSGRAPYDIVFCRNLLIYLTPEARARVEAVLDRLVAADGLLVVGAAEPPILKGDWIPAGASSIFALRRGVRSVAKPALRPPTPAPPRRSEAKSAAPVRPAARIAAATAATTEAAAIRSLDDVLREAGALANVGRITDALALCDAHAREVGPAPQLFFLMGMLHQSAGDLDRAEGCFHKTLYLDAAHDEALLALALLAAQRGDPAMAEKYRQSAARILARKASP
ncbi:MAG: protein-glutamate O-methyltransferase CheR [Planctomycetia bacterium]